MPITPGPDQFLALSRAEHNRVRVDVVGRNSITVSNRMALGKNITITVRCPLVGVRAGPSPSDGGCNQGTRTVHELHMLHICIAHYARNYHTT